MINPHRSAFGNEKKEDSLENNLDKVVNLTQLKIKELTNKNQDKLRENNFLKSQFNQIQNDVKYVEIEISQKKQTLPIMKQELEKLENEIESCEKDYKQSLKEFNKKNEEFLFTMLTVGDDLESANNKNSAVETNKNSKYRIEYEKYSQIKEENQKLTDMMFNLRRELYQIEVIFSNLILGGL